ncbi:MAG: 1-hydroxycarotenoid 3,4-desaturase CrtD [Ferruginibacter sp.]
MQPKKIIVIGSGIAGMAAAIRLAINGHEVTVYEKNESYGGKIASFVKDGFFFDTGPSLFTEPGNIEELFQLAGESCSAYLQYEKLPITCKYFFENNKQFTAYSNAEGFYPELQQFSGEDAIPVKQYLKNAAQLYNNAGGIFLNKSLHKRSTWLNKNIFSVLKITRVSYIIKTLSRYNRQKLKSPEVQQIFNRYATYNGSNPYKAPGMLSLIPHLEFNAGVYYPAGGMQKITDALFALAKKTGVHFHFNSPVQRIIHAEGKVEGVVVNNQNYFAHTVISNADIYITYKQLLRNDVKSQKVLKPERSSSALVFYWGMGKQFPHLDVHNILFAKDYFNEFNQLFRLKNISNDPTVYINITAKKDCTHAPAGKENWFVMINAPSNTGQNWEQITNTSRKNIIQKINAMLGEDIAPLIETETICDPIMIEKNTGSFMGSLYGASSNSIFSAFLRHPNFSSFAKGLYCCGGTVHPGGGIPLCLKSAKITTEIMEADFRKHKHH